MDPRQKTQRNCSAAVPSLFSLYSTIHTNDYRLITAHAFSSPITLLSFPICPCTIIQTFSCKEGIIDLRRKQAFLPADMPDSQKNMYECAARHSLLFPDGRERNFLLFPHNFHTLYRRILCFHSPRTHLRNVS